MIQFIFSTRSLVLYRLVFGVPEASGPTGEARAKAMSGLGGPRRQLEHVRVRRRLPRGRGRLEDEVLRMDKETTKRLLKSY